MGKRAVLEYVRHRSLLLGAKAQNFCRLKYKKRHFKAWRQPNNEALHE